MTLRKDIDSPKDAFSFLWGDGASKCARDAVVGRIEQVEISETCREIVWCEVL